MPGGAFGREVSSAALAEADTVAAALGEAGQVRVGGADARVLFVLAGARPDILSAGGRAAAVLRMEDGSGAAVLEEQQLSLGAPGAGDIRPFKSQVPLAVSRVAKMSSTLCADGEGPRHDGHPFAGGRARSVRPPS